MRPPCLTFFCELETDPLKDLFAGVKLTNNLKSLEAGLSLGILDLSAERAKVVQKLNRAGIPVTAWLLLPKEEGYWFNLDNVSQALTLYQDFLAWTADHGLQWAAIGLDIEPDIRVLQQLSASGWRSLLKLMPKLATNFFDRKRLTSARREYAGLVKRIRAEGYSVESYQFPIIADERKTGSTLLQRLSGLVDIQVDREVWMLYSSFIRPAGVGFLWSYAPQAQAIAVGVTGRGVESDSRDEPPMTWDELARDLRLAWYWADQIYIFSLEGCVSQGYLDRLKTFEWDQPILVPEELARPFNAMRSVLRSLLWVGSHLTAILVASLAGGLLFVQLRRLMRSRKQG
jgi:hypothetical protein